MSLDKLGSWKSYGIYKNIYNYYRTSNIDLIGFTLMDAVILRKTPEKALWRVDCAFASTKDVRKCYDIYKQSFGEYVTIDELEIAKERLSKIIDNFATLKVFF